MYFLRCVTRLIKKFRQDLRAKILHIFCLLRQPLSHNLPFTVILILDEFILSVVNKYLVHVNIWLKNSD